MAHLMRRDDRLDELTLRVGGVEATTSYYVSPWVTCAECNALNWVEGYVFAPSKRGLAAPSVPLPVCVGCGHAVEFRAGAADLSGLVAEKRAAVAAAAARRVAAATTLAGAWRCYTSRRMLALLRELERRRRERMRWAATALQKLWRGLTSRRTGTTQRYLRRIARAHAETLWAALHGAPSADPLRPKRVFWYKRREEQDLICEDYRLFVARTGNQPPLRVVEDNIIELGRRIDEYETARAILIQKMFRSLAARVFVRMLFEENARLFNARWNGALILQCFWRRTAARARVGGRRALGAKARVMRGYKLERARQLREDATRSAGVAALSMYKQETREARAAVFTGKIAYGAFGGNHVKALRDSAYGGARAGQAIHAFLARRVAEEEDKARWYAMTEERNRWIDARVEDGGVGGHVWRSYYARAEIHRDVKEHLTKSLIDDGRLVRRLKVPGPDGKFDQAIVPRREKKPAGVA